ncbi:MAG TPA: BamA/TamA family outer membrane protein, partial [Casimicrobiaceae bacterium]|nr:BamA/TamA family outer membrane protein [Casimicrobiaceae bacterium]
EVEAKVDRSTEPRTVTLRVVPGTPTRVNDVNISVSGPAAADAQYGQPTISKLRDEWLLKREDIFTQTRWDDAKQRAVKTLGATGYPAARLESSKAAIDPDAHQADVSVGIASGPQFRFGEFRIKGLERYSEELVRNYSGIHQGDVYTLVALDQYLRRLNGTGYFASVHAAVDVEASDPDAAPVDIAVIEAPPKRIEAGIGFSTDTQYRGNVSYRDVDFAGHALQFSFDTRVESKLQNVNVRIVQPPNVAGWSTAWSALAERTDISGLITQTATAGVRRISLDERNQWQYGLALVDDEQRASNDGGIANAHAMYVDVERDWRRVDDLLSPTRGYVTIVQAGVGVPAVSSEAFFRLVGKFETWHPLGTSNELYYRAEAGAVFAKTRDDVPSSLLFRTGGDKTVRGYAFESLGLQQGDVTLPTRYYAVTSVEVTHWINDTFGVAGFVDAGDAFDNASTARVAVGYGIGGRVRTPIGPFRLDLAYGEQSKQVRLHFSVGLLF